MQQTQVTQAGAVSNETGSYKVLPATPRSYVSVLRIHKHHADQRLTRSNQRTDSAYTGSSPLTSGASSQPATPSQGSAVTYSHPSSYSHQLNPIQDGRAGNVQQQPTGNQQFTPQMPLHNSNFTNTYTSSASYSAHAGSEQHQTERPIPPPAFGGYPTANTAFINQPQNINSALQRGSGSYSERDMPKGKGRALRGSYTGPSTLHYEELDRSYYVRGKAFFFEGRVFSIIMSENAGMTATKKSGFITDYTTSSSVNEVKYRDNMVYTSARRFVVVRRKQEFCYACPIFTYSGRATTKPGVRPSEHGIAYSWGQRPELLPGEGGMTKPSLSVVMGQGVPALDKASRIYYGIIHPIQYNVKVKEIGYVPQEQVPILIGSWREEDNKDTDQPAYITAHADIPELDESASQDMQENEDYETTSDNLEDLANNFSSTNI